MSSHKTQELLAFIKQLPAGIAYAPIYAKGCKLQSGKESKGKTPLERSHHQSMNAADVALQVERQPAVFQAVGAFTGPRSGGLVILDVDHNLSRLKKKWGETLENAPVVTSTKANAAKYLYRVPEALWGKVRGFGLSDTGSGYEVLWGRQGVIYGAYPGSSDGKAPAGHYGFEGDLEAIPEAPEWLLAEMRDHCGKELQDGGFIKNRKALDFSDRDPDEVAEIIQSALKVIPGQGAGSRDFWVKVGMAIHSELPTDLGMTLWAAWSAEDPEFHNDWVGANPCEEVWKSFRKGPVSLGTLFYLADQQMPGRLWLSEDLRKVVADAEQDNVTRIRNVVLNFAEVVKRAKAIQEIENPAEAAHAMNTLALEAGYRDAGALERLLISQIQFEDQDEVMSLETLLSKDLKFEYLIPDLLPCPGVVMVHGAGGDGKSMSAWTIAKHVARGLPFNVRGDLVPVQQGPVLILNGDQSEVQVQQQMRDLEFTDSDPVHVQMGWDLNWYFRFIKLIKKHQPKLVVIDSITGCSRGSAFDENKKEFASPIYWLANNNGRTFDACTILLIHHANKTGGFRGTTAIRDAVDEVWGLRRPDKKQLERVGSNARLISVEKSRAGRDGTKLLMKLEEDLTFSLADYVEVDEDSASPASVVDRVLNRLRSAYPRALSRPELAADPLCGGSVAGIRKGLQRLVSRGLIEAVDSKQGSKGGSPAKTYRAVLSRDMCVNKCPTEGKPSQELESPVGQRDAVSHWSERLERENPGMIDAAAKTLRDQWDTPKPCPTAKASAAKGSASVGQDLHISPREERTPDQLNKLQQDASDFWN
jgi:hypothetical protein